MIFTKLSNNNNQEYKIQKDKKKTMELCENKSVCIHLKIMWDFGKRKTKGNYKKKNERKQKTVGSPIEMRDPP